MTKILLTIVATLLFSVSAHAARNFPANAQAGELRGIQHPLVQIGDKVYRLGAGARIYDANNRIVLPVAAPQSGAVVFQLDAQGFLSKVWVLTPEEAALIKK
jgi:hypothetical protein